MLYKGSSLQVGFLKSRYWPGLVVHRFGLAIFGSMPWASEVVQDFLTPVYVQYIYYKCEIWNNLACGLCNLSLFICSDFPTHLYLGPQGNWEKMGIF